MFQLNDSLRSRKVRNVVVNLGIVRGLDYYSGIVFEATDPSLKIGALVGGGDMILLPKRSVGKIWVPPEPQVG